MNVITWPQSPRDWLILVSLFVFVITMNVSTVLSYRATQHNIERTQVNREYLDDLMRSTGVCTLRSSGAVNTEQIPFTPEAIEKYYNDCLRERVK